MSKCKGTDNKTKDIHTITKNGYEFVIDHYDDEDPTILSGQTVLAIVNDEIVCTQKERLIELGLVIDEDKELIIKNVFDKSKVLSSAIENKYSYEKSYYDNYSDKLCYESFDSTGMQFEYRGLDFLGPWIEVDTYFENMRIVARYKDTENNIDFEIHSYEELEALLKSLSKKEPYAEILLSRVLRLKSIGFTFKQKDNEKQPIYKK